MAYDPKAIANYFLSLAEEHGTSLSPMKVQKLVYFAHGWHLALRDAPLVNEQVEAWRYGPVIPSLYRAFREYGERSITAPATASLDDPNGDPWCQEIVVPCLEDQPEDAEAAGEFLDRVWEIYGKYTAVQLSNLTHEPDSPWDQIYKKYNGNPPHGTDIPAEIIRDYFARLAESEAAD